MQTPALNKYPRQQHQDLKNKECVALAVTSETPPSRKHSMSDRILSLLPPSSPLPITMENLQQS